MALNISTYNNIIIPLLVGPITGSISIDGMYLCIPYMLYVHILTHSSGRYSRCSGSSYMLCLLDKRTSLYFIVCTRNTLYSIFVCFLYSVPNCIRLSIGYLLHIRCKNYNYYSSISST